MNAPTMLAAGVNDRERFREVWRKLHEYCTTRGWRGYDPYDGLNSPLARVLPGKDRAAGVDAVASAKPDQPAAAVRD